MSGTNTNPVYGPRTQSRLALMGIRFVNDEGDGTGAGGGDGGYTPPATQDDLNRIIQDRIARERDKFKDYDTIRTELDTLRNERKTADERALDAARNEGRDEVRSVLATERVNNTFTRELQGRTVDPAALLTLDRTQFIKDDSADVDAVKQWVQQHSTETKTVTPRDPGQGNRDTSGAGGTVQAGRDLYDLRKK